MKSRTTWILLLGVFAITYGLAWKATDVWGRTAVQRHVVREYAEKAGLRLAPAKPPWFEPVRLNHNDFRERPLHGYRVEVSAPFPFVLKVDRSEYHGPSFHGEKELYLWFVWGQSKVATRNLSERQTR